MAEIAFTFSEKLMGFFFPQRTSHGSTLLPYAVVKGKGNHNDVLRRLFVAGDDRVRVVPGLSAMHMVFVLEHNRVAR